MALKTDYKDYVADGARKYRLTANADGTTGIEDATAYAQQGDRFGAADINATNAAVNAALPKAGGTMTGAVTFTANTDFLVEDTVRYRIHLNTGSVSNPNAFVLQVFDPSNWVVDPIIVNTDGSIVIKGYTTFNRAVQATDANARHCLRNIAVQNAGFENQATGHILMVRK